MADLTPEKEQEFKFRLRLEQEQAQEKAAQAEAESQKGYINPLTPTIVGAAVGPVVGPNISKGAMAYRDTQDLIKQGWDPKVASNFVRKQYGAVENWTRQMHSGEFFGGRDMPQANRIAMQTKYPQGIPQTFPEAAPPGMKAAPSSGLILPENLVKSQETAATKPAAKPSRMPGSSAFQSGKSALSAGLSGGIPAILGRGIAGGSTAYQGVDAYNRLKSGDVGGGLISGVGALGSAASFLPHPILRYGGVGVAMGAEALNQYLDSLKQKREGYAEGGSAKKKMSKAERAAKAIRENNKKKVPHLSNGGLPPAENAARTQIIGTLPTYEKAEEELKKRGAQGRALDFGAGLGEGAKILKADTYEPFPKGWKPTFIDPKQIPTEAYGKLTNLNVMNVVPRNARDEMAGHIGRVIEPGGQGIITTRGADVMKAKGRPGPEPMSIITSRDTYQKGFTKQELEDYMKRMLGEKYDVNKVNLGPAGVHVQKKKPTIYTGGGLSIPVNAPVGSRAQETTGQGAAQILNPLNLNFKEGGSTTPAWQRSEGKSPSGGLNAVGRASYKRETGGELKAPQPEGGSRKKSFCARMGGMKKKLTSSKTANDPDSRINKALRKWKC